MALLAVVLGVVVAATSATYNGQWLLGVIIAGLGLAYLWYTRKDKTNA